MSKIGVKARNMKKWDGFNFELNRTYEKPLREGTDSSDECNSFRRAFRNYLKKELAPYGWTLVKSKPNYFDVTEVVTDGEHFAYVSVGDVRYTRNVCAQILYRTMKHEKDWTGGPNRYANIDELPAAIANLKF